MMKKLSAGFAAIVPVLAAVAYFGWSFLADSDDDEDYQGVGAAIAADIEASRPNGSFRATGGDLGEWEMNVNRCQSGERHQFSGVILYDAEDTDRQIRIIETPQGQRQVAVQVPDVGVTTFDDCETLEAQIEPTGTVLNFRTEIAGSVTLSCPNLEGTATFPSCS